MIDPTTATSATTASDQPQGESSDTAGVAGAANQQLGKDEFLKLLVAQMKNQNPMNPMKGREMASQMAQFSSVEQLIQLNENFSSQQQGQEKLQRTIDHGTAAEIIGDRVLAEGDSVQLPESGDGSVTFELGGAGSATLEVFDASGQKVGARDLGHLEEGRHEVSLGSAADGLEAGNYRYDVSVDGGESAPPVTTFTSGVVDGVRFSMDGPVLRVGEMEIPFGNVQEVSSASEQ